VLSEANLRKNDKGPKEEFGFLAGGKQYNCTSRETVGLGFLWKGILHRSRGPHGLPHQGLAGFVATDREVNSLRSAFYGRAFPNVPSSWFIV